MKLKLLLEDGEFGESLFNRVKQGGNHIEEPDTPLEKKFGEALEYFIEGGSDGMHTSTKMVQAVKVLMNMKSDYPHELKYKGSKPLYRGLKGEIYDIKRNVTLKALEKGKKIKIEGQTVFSVPITYQPHSAVQSGTTSVSIADDFATNHAGAILMSTKIPKKELLFNPDFMSAISRTVLGSEEHEVVRFGGKMRCTLLIPLNRVPTWSDYNET